MNRPPDRPAGRLSGRPADRPAGQRARHRAVLVILAALPLLGGVSACSGGGPVDDDGARRALVTAAEAGVPDWETQATTDTGTLGQGAGGALLSGLEGVPAACTSALDALAAADPDAKAAASVALAAPGDAPDQLISFSVRSFAGEPATPAALDAAAKACSGTFTADNDGTKTTVTLDSPDYGGHSLGLTISGTDGGSAHLMASAKGQNLLVGYSIGTSPGAVRARFEPAVKAQLEKFSATAG